MRRLLVAIAVVAVLLLAADRLAAFLAGRGVAAAVQRSRQLPAAPDVSIEGLPFLTQAVQGRYRQVDVHLRDVPVQDGVGVEEIRARLVGVRLALGDALSGRVDQVPVDRADATARLPFAALDAVARQRVGAGADGVRFGPGSAPDRLSVSGVLPRRQLPFRAEARLDVRRGALAVSLVPGSVAGAPAAVRDRVAGLLDGLAFRVPPLPFGLRVTDVRVDPGGLLVSAAARDVVLS